MVRQETPRSFKTMRIIPNTLLLLLHPLPRHPSFRPRLLHRRLVLHETRRQPYRYQRELLNAFCSCPNGTRNSCKGIQFSSWISPTLKLFRCAMMNGMDHLAVLREKITGLRAEIAQIQESNNQYRREGRSEPQSQVAHGQRQERLQAIQQELAKVADLGRRVLTVEQRKAEHRVRIHPKAS